MIKRHSLNYLIYILTCALFLTSIGFLSVWLINKQTELEINKELKKCAGKLTNISYKGYLSALEKAEKIKNTSLVLEILRDLSYKLVGVKMYDVAANFIYREMELDKQYNKIMPFHPYYTSVIEFLSAKDSLNFLLEYGHSKLKVIESTHDSTEDSVRNNDNARSLLKYMIRASLNAKNYIVASSLSESMIARGKSNSIICDYDILGDIYMISGDLRKEYEIRESYIDYVDSMYITHSGRSVDYNISTLSHFIRLGELELKRGNKEAALKWLNRGEKVNISQVIYNAEQFFFMTDVLRNYIKLYRIEDSLYTSIGDKEQSLRVKDSIISAANYVYLAKNYDLAECKKIGAFRVNFDMAIEKERSISRYYFIIIIVLGCVIILVTIIFSYFLMCRSKATGVDNQRLDAGELSGNDEGFLEYSRIKTGTKKTFLAVENNELKSNNTAKIEGVFKNMEVAMKGGLYLNKNLRREDLAKSINTNSTYIYLAVKYFTGSDNFNDYVNAYRVNYACSLLLKHENYNIEGIALESGFLTRQTCYRAFATHLSMTPKEYLTIELAKINNK